MSDSAKLQMLDETPLRQTTTRLPPPPPLPAVTAAPAQIEEPPVAVEDEAGESLFKGIIGGSIAAVIGALIWAAITATTHFQIGWMAVGVGFLVGYGVRWLGRGTKQKFGFVGGTLACLGCLMGNLLAYTIIDAQAASVPIWAAVLGMVLKPGLALDRLYAGFGPMDFLFYALAIYEGYRFSFNNIADEY